MKTISNTEKALILSQALPYIQKYHNKIVVIKYGGNAMIDETMKQTVMEDIVLLSTLGIKVILVHGGGPEINKSLTAMGIESRFIDGLRYTDQPTMEVVQMVMAGKINKDLVHQLSIAGGKAIGLCGLDNHLLTAEPLHTEKDLGYVGQITSVNTKFLIHLLDMGYIPVVSTIAGDEKKNVYNINADTAASAIAAELVAENLCLMTDIPGLLKDKDDDSTLIDYVHINDVPELKAQGIISGGMIPKIDSCVHAVQKGVAKAFIMDGRVPHSILIELLTNEGLGTMFSIHQKKETKNEF